MDVMRMLFLSNMVDESLNHQDCAISFEQGQIALECTYELFDKPVPAGHLDRVKLLGHLVDVGDGDQIVEVPIDPFIEAVLGEWTGVVQEGSHLVDATFAKHDENGDGTLSLEEFTGTPISPRYTGHFARLLSRCVGVQQRW